MARVLEKFPGGVVVLQASVGDGELVARCRAGDQTAWRELVERFSRYVFAIAIKGFRLSEQDAEDVFQEVFTRTYANLDRLRDDNAIRPWLAQLTRRLAIDHLRSSRSEVAADEVPELAGTDERLEQIDLALDVHRAMERLPENCQAILDRFFARDESYQTISAALEIPAGTIASRISRCLRKLQTELSPKRC